MERIGKFINGLGDEVKIIFWSSIGIIIVLLMIIGALMPDNRPDHVTPNDLVESERICKDHKGVSSVKYYRGLDIRCNDFYMIDNYVYE